MSKVIYEDHEFKVLKTSKNIVLVRKTLEYKNHAHFDTFEGAKLLMNCFNNRLLPSKTYFKTAMKRICTLEEYEAFIEKKKKDKYFNTQKGIKR